MATGHIGTAAIPNVGDLVLLTFDRGDVNQPIVIGRLYNDEDRPPLNRADEIIFRLPLVESDGDSILAAVRNHRNSSPPREAVLEMPPKITLRVTDGTIKATAGSSEMTLDQPDGNGGEVSVVAGRTRISMSQDGDVTVEAAGSMTLRATRDLNVEGLNVNITSQQGLSLQAGTNAELQAGLEAKLVGGLAATVQGTSVSVRGITSFSP